MIPTSAKPKLPKSLSYPLGAKEISDALADAPHTGELKLDFRREACWPASKFQRVLRDGRPYKILATSYMPPNSPREIARDKLTRSRFQGGHWWISVYSVKRESRSVARGLLFSVGLPAVIAWLKSSGKVGWEYHQHSIELVFNPIEITLEHRLLDIVSI